MLNQKDELIGIITKFAESGWDLIDSPSKAWLESNDDSEESETVNLKLISAIKKADQECGNCGCEYDELYKRALFMLDKNSI